MNKKFISQEGPKFLLGLISTACGVLIALLINSQVDEKKDEIAYRSMLKVLNVEAQANAVVLNSSFLPNFNKIIVYREFSLRNSEEIIGNQLFLKHADSTLINSVVQYNLNLKRANAFRVALEKYHYDEKLYKKWGSLLIKSLGSTLRDCNSSIRSVREKTK